MENPLERIDYPMLRGQKLALVEMQREEQMQGDLGDETRTKYAEALQGIIHFLDDVQDYATLELGRTAAEVFGDEIPDSPRPGRSKTSN